MAADLSMHQAAETHSKGDSIKIFRYSKVVGLTQKPLCGKNGKDAVEKLDEAS